MNESRYENSITFDDLLNAAGADKLTQYGLQESIAYAHFDKSDVTFVVSSLRVIERANKNAIFVYPKGTVQPIRGIIS